MKLQIHYKQFYKTICCPANTLFLGVKVNDINVNSGIEYFFDDIECITQQETLPNGTKIKFYFYISNDYKLHTLMKEMKATHLTFTQDHLTITSINE